MKLAKTTIYDVECVKDGILFFRSCSCFLCQCNHWDTLLLVISVLQSNNVLTEWYWTHKMSSLVDDVSVAEKLAKVYVILKMWKIKMMFVCFWIMKITLTNKSTTLVTDIVHPLNSKSFSPSHPFITQQTGKENS